MLDVVMVGPFPERPSLIRGGVQASVYGLARALSRRSVARVSVLSLPVKAAAEATVTTQTEGGIEVTRLTIPYKFFASIIVHLPLAMRKIRRLHRPIVHVHGTGLFQASLLALLRLKRIPVVWTLHGITEKEAWQRYREHRTAANFLRHRLYRLVERFSLRISPVLIFDTPYVLAEVPPTGNDVHVIPQGIFTEEFAGLPREPRDPPPLVLSLGVLSLRKGHHLTLEAFARVKAEVPAARLVIAGTVTDPNYHRHLQARTRELGLGDSVDILVDLPRHEIVALLGRGHVFALHSQEESQGIALCEALAAGLPVVATRVGGIPHVVEDGKSGILVPYGDVPGFAEAIIELLSDPTRHARMAGHARASATRFDWDTIAGQMEWVYANAHDPRRRSEAEMEDTIQDHVRAGWTFDAPYGATGVLTSPHDPECTIVVNARDRRIDLSPKIAMTLADRIEFARPAAPRS